MTMLTQCMLTQYCQSWLNCPVSIRSLIDGQAWGRRKTPRSEEENHVERQSLWTMSGPTPNSPIAQSGGASL